MESQNISLLVGVWVQLPVAKSVYVNHRSGGLVIYSASNSEPAAPSASTSIIDSTKIREVTVLDGMQSSLWACALNTAATLSITELVTVSSAITKHDNLATPLLNTNSVSMSELYTALGRRYSHKFDVTFPGNSTKYFLYKLPAFGADFILSVQERIFRSLNSSAQLQVLNAASGYTAAAPVTNIQKANFVVVNTPQLEIYNLTDTAGNSNPSADGAIFDTDFVAGQGSGSNSSGGFSPQTGSRLYPAGGASVIRVTNLDNSSNRIMLEYSWIELPLSYLD